MVSDVAGELKVAPTVLGEQGKETVKFGLGNADNFSSSFFSKLFKVELSSGAKCFDGGCRSRWGWGADDIRVGINGGGLEGVWVDKGNAGVSK